MAKPRNWCSPRLSSSSGLRRPRCQREESSARIKQRRTVALGVLLIVSLVTEGLAHGANAGVVVMLRGSGRLIRFNVTTPMPLKLYDRLSIHDRITTEDQSFVRLLLVHNAMISMREHSALTISEADGEPVITLERGRIATWISKDQSHQGAAQLRAPNAVAEVSDALLLAEVSIELGNGTLTRFTVLRGFADIRATLAGDSASNPRVHISRLETVTLTGAASPGMTHRITEAEARALERSFDGASLPSDPISRP
jgi:FecR-like protein